MRWVCCLQSRLRSIAEDAEAFHSFADLYFPHLPRFGNLRCGKWYVSPSAQDCYFKSTDGHCHHWQFAWSRTNLHVARACALSASCLKGEPMTSEASAGQAAFEDLKLSEPKASEILRGAIIVDST